MRGRRRSARVLRGAGLHGVGVEQYRPAHEHRAAVQLSMSKFVPVSPVVGSRRWRLGLYHVTVLGLVGGAPGGRHRASPIRRLGCTTAPSSPLGREPSIRPARETYSQPQPLLRPTAPAGTARSTGSSGSRYREPSSLHGAPSAEGGSAHSARPNSLAAKRRGFVRPRHSCDPRPR